MSGTGMRPAAAAESRGRWKPGAAAAYQITRELSPDGFGPRRERDRALQRSRLMGRCEES